MLSGSSHFIRFNGKRHPETLGKHEIEAFLSDMATNKNYAASTQNLAFNSIAVDIAKLVAVQY